MDPFGPLCFLFVLRYSRWASTPGGPSHVTICNPTDLPMLSSYSSRLRAATGALALLWALLFLPTALAQGLSPMDVAEIKTVTSATIAADGQHVAYTVSEPADPTEDNVPASTHLYVMDTETGEVTASYTESGVGSVAFRPAHGTVTFLTSGEDDDGRVLYELAVDGEEPTRLLGHATSIAAYTWAPDGERVAFSANEELDIPEAPLPYQPDLFEENQPQRHAFIADLSADTPAPHRINVDGTVYLMRWSPDGSQLAITEAPTPGVDDSFMAQSVQVVDAESRDVVANIANAGKIAQIKWSPDGEHLALRAGDNIHDPIDGRIMRVAVEDGAIPENILPEFEGKFEQILWTDDDTIHFLASESTARSFGTIAPDGSDFTRILTKDATALASFTPSGAGHIVFTASTPEHPQEVYLLRDGTDSPDRVTHHNEWLADRQLGTQEVVRYTARDGLFDIEGLLIYPLDYEEGTAVPLIVMVHGGPEAHYSNGWLTNYSMPGQVGAAEGYAVFYPNYRGSTGRGLDFILSSQGDLAGKEFDDIVDGVDYLINRGIADEDRVGVTGGSYGGYASAWMSTYYSPRFAAAVMNVGISNNISKWGTSDIPEELYLVHSRTRIWDSWVDNLKRSPIYHVDNAQTPILIAHGAEDTRVHPAQSLELYRHLKVRTPEVPVRLALYPDEGHGYIRASARLDYNLRMMRWFDTYLKGDDPQAPLPAGNVEVPEQ